MSVESIKARINTNNTAKKIKVVRRNPYAMQNATSAPKQVAFTGGFSAPNPVVWLMDVIATGGYALSFILQDGIGFIAPRVGKGLTRGGKKKRDENGNEILDKNGNPKRELNWAYAKKEGIREIITGPSAFVIPLVLLKGIKKKFGAANNVKLNYIDGFKNAFTDYAKNNTQAILNGNPDKTSFYKQVFADTIKTSINSHLSDTEKMSASEIEKIAQSYADKQVKIDKVNSELSGFFQRKQRKEALAQIGSSIEEDFMKLKKQKIGGNVDEMAVELLTSKGVKAGSISEMTSALGDYFDDAVKNVHSALKKDGKATIENIMSHFTKRRMGSRLLTNIGLFLSVAAFYTQIPKLYNMGTNGVNPALANEEEPALQSGKTVVANDSVAPVKDKVGKGNVSFGSAAGMVEKAGSAVFNNKTAKYWSDVFELSGPVIQGNAMSILLYGFCIPPRLFHAQDKYDYGEIVLRDMTAFTALLFGAKALARVFSDGFTKLTGLALNSKSTQGRKWYQKVIDYLNPEDKRHSVLSSKQLESKYTNLEDYKCGVNGFIDFIEKSGGNLKKALSHDKNVKAVVEEILKAKGKTFARSSSQDIKTALSEAHQNKTDLIKKFYKLFEGQNGILKLAKTCNSTFGFLSTIVLVPGLIWSLTDMCKAMTDKRRAKEKELAVAKMQPQQVPLVPSSMPTMAGFLNR